MSLARRIVASVALGLGLILLLFGLVAQRTIQDSTEVAYRERVMLAQVLASRLDEVLREYTGLPVVVAEDALSCVALGTGRALEERQRLRQVLSSAY